MRNLALRAGHRGPDRRTHRLRAVCGRGRGLRLRGPLDVLERDRALRTGAGDLRKVEAECLGARAGGGRDAASDVGACNDRCRCGGRGHRRRPRGRCGNGLRPLLCLRVRGRLARLEQARDDRADRDGLAHVGGELPDRALLPDLDVDRRLARVDDRDDRALRDGVAGLHLPLEQRALVHFGAERGKPEFEHGTASGAADLLPDRGDDLRGLRQRRLLEVLRVGHRHLLAADARDRRVEIVERLLHDPRHHFRCEAA